VIDQLAALSPTTTPAISPLVPMITVEATFARSVVRRSTVAPSPIEAPRPTATPLAPRWIAPQAGSKLGLHVTFGPRDGLDDFLARCAEADKPVAVVKCVDDFEAAFKAKQYSERTLTVGRVNGVGLNNRDFVDMQAWEPPEFSPAIGVAYTSAQDAARVYFELVKPLWQLNPVIDVWEMFNEFSWHWGWQADFYITLMDLAEAEGYRLGLWSQSAGNPPEEFYPDIARVCRRAKEHGNHILCLHEYNFDGLLRAAPKNLVTRYRQLYKYLAEAEAVIPLVISEAGENAGGGFTGVETFMDDFTWYDRQLSKDDYVIGCAMWTLGDWEGANFQAALPFLAAYISGQPLTLSKTYVPLIANTSSQ
ncbi:MAG: hypothetical protein KA765_19910, partial [Thermoflexales bacterium]|nr:hypothetical protein [Thermoflexales bacterium]